jgi:tRNA threonylcarbamoyladenosine biosynthesis protein TsaE
MQIHLQYEKKLYMTITYRLEGIEKAAAHLLETHPGARVFALNGVMGAGKTTLVSAICKALGVNSAVSSPTYSIINQYEMPGAVVYHIDLYRVAGAEEAIAAGVEEAMYSGDYCFVEWPGRAPGILPDDTVYVTINIISPVERQLQTTESASFEGLNGGNA